jgi:hypothetical protein
MLINSENSVTSLGAADAAADADAGAEADAGAGVAVGAAEAAAGVVAAGDAGAHPVSANPIMRHANTKLIHLTLFLPFILILLFISK